MLVDYVEALRSDLDAAVPRLLEIDEEVAATPARPGAWSPREVIGHLIDSASVNHERFVRGVVSGTLVFPGYEQDAWVRVQAYGTAPWLEIVELWAGLNRHLARVVSAVPPGMRHRLVETHNLDRIGFRPVPAGLPASLDQLMFDYVAHLEHHVTQVLGSGWAFAPPDASAPAGRHVLETGRLVLRELTNDDLPFVAEMLGDAETMRHYPWVQVPIEARAWLARQHARYSGDGHGLWLVVERATGERVGQVGLAMQEVDGRREPEIGWLVRRRHWRRGIAAEAAAAVRDFAFAMGLDRVISLIRPGNEPSQGVARRVGMTVERETQYKGYPHYVFSLRRPPA